MEVTKIEQTGTWASDAETVDLQAVILLRSLAERDGRSLGPIMTGALLHAAGRLWDCWNPEANPSPHPDEDDEEEDEDDGPLSLDGGPGREMMFG